MRPILLGWRGCKIRSYPAMLYLGSVAGVAAGNLAAHPVGVNAFRVFVATLILFPAALAGARLFYVAAHWNHYRDRPGRIWNRREGGLAMYGGLPAMLVLSVPLLAVLGVSYGAFWDVAAFTLLTGMIFTKIGCLLNGCCAGRPSRSRAAVFLPNIQGAWESRIPIQCLESAWAAVLLACACMLLGRLPLQGALSLSAAALYSAGRIVLESTREPDPEAKRFTSGFAVPLAVVVSAIGILAFRWPK